MVPTPSVGEVVRFSFKNGSTERRFKELLGGDGFPCVWESTQYETRLWAWLPSGEILEWTTCELGTARLATADEVARLAAKLRRCRPDQWELAWNACDGFRDISKSATEANFLASITRRADYIDVLLPAGVTVLNGDSKLGKTTLVRAGLRAGHLAALPPLHPRTPYVDQDRRPDAKFLGRDVRPFGALVVSEERSSRWAETDPNTRLIPYTGDPIRKLSAWRDYVRQLEMIARRRNLDVIVLDSFSRICGADENSARAITPVFAELRGLCERQDDMAVLILHHSNRSGGVRGSTAIEAQADNLLSLLPASDDTGDRRRRLEYKSRDPEVGRGVIEYEMDAAGELVLTAPAASPKAKGGSRTDAAAPAPPAPKMTLGRARKGG